MHSSGKVRSLGAIGRRVASYGFVLAMALGAIAATATTATATQYAAPQANGVYSLLSGGFMTVPQASTSSGVQLQSWNTTTNGDHQDFEFRNAGWYGNNPYFTIHPRHTYHAGNTLCLDVYGAFTSDWTGIHQYTCTGGSNQKFTPVHDGAGRYALKALHSGKYIGVHNGNIGQSPTPVYWNLVQQQFRFPTMPVKVAPFSSAFSPQYTCTQGWKFIVTSSQNGFDYYKYDNIGTSAVHRVSEVDNNEAHVAIAEFYNEDVITKTGQVMLYCGPIS
ncbi:RICIN domain-containing protein [Lentzea sp. NPDC051208]|uniref:RICIN domain-containing protein n=1 Tax=Lentzea sp. NPDC051208 TaxID=3154642 RepID=UPI00343B23D4